MDDAENVSNEETGRFGRASNQSALREHNERLVLTLLRNKGPMSKSHIAKLTGLSAQAAGVIMSRLETEGLLRRGVPQRGRVGQPSVPMAVAPDCAHFIGLKIGRRVSEMVLIDFMGKILHQCSQPHFCPTPDETIIFAKDGTTKLLETLPAEARQRVAGIGVATPFQLWEWAEQIGAPPETIASWRDADIGARLRKCFSWPVHIQNDASAACGAELAFGNPPENNFLYFFLGSLIGGGVVLDGSLYTGSRGNAGALGSMPITRRDRGGHLLTQLIDVASISSLERKMILADLHLSGVRNSPDSWTVPDDLLESWVREAGDALAQAALAACAVIDFEAVIIDGSLPKSVRARIVDRAKDTLSTVNDRGIDLPIVREGAVGANARALGAASLPLFDRYLLPPRSLSASQTWSG
ncbi:ROK family transcriptional regulator [Notoacmeibacter sp. MSK16QG-6]|uniref:ROK family transcriptional regulator n=1 Tax=Notoacmeibacter sp. MSK16QG-6 TaxID=2957982 RepID=UPI0020A01AEB|nr:ROK family transcriptional regulator [Notoacmeibacter sp. MSK16QG-6]MCP1198051.1 ROK family transcriptional regulator [Notoacmeibacter sp. MSK16QG-6]